MQKVYKFAYKNGDDDFALRWQRIAAFAIGALLMTLFASITGHAQRPTALTEKCAGQSQTIRNQIFAGTDGNIHLTPCPGKGVYVNGNLLGSNGIFTNGSILFQHLNSGMISNDVTLAGDSGVRLTTEHAVKTYVDAVTGFVTLSSLQRYNYNGSASPVVNWTNATTELFNNGAWHAPFHNTGDTFDPNGQENLVSEGIYRTGLHWFGDHDSSGVISGLTNGQVYIVRIHSWRAASLHAAASTTFYANVNGGANAVFVSEKNKALVREITFTAAGGTAQLNIFSNTDDIVAISAIEVFEQTISGSNTIASNTQIGKTRLSVAPDDASNPIAVGNNDPRLNSDLAIADFANFAAAETAAASAGKALLVTENITFTANETITVPLVFKAQGRLTANAGVTVSVNDEIEADFKQIFFGAGKFNFQSAKTRRIVPEWWGATGLDSTDDAAAINNAARALSPVGVVESNGGTIYFPSTGYRFGTTFDWELLNNVTFEGNESLWNGGTHTLTYTGAATPAISLNATRGLVFRRMRFHTGASFGGVFIQGGYGGAYGDTNNNAFEKLSFFSPGSSATLMTLDRVISSQIRDCNFVGGAIGIHGAVTSADSNANLIEANHFKGQNIASIKAVGQFWTIINNTFSGGAATAYAVTTDDAEAVTSRALYFANNYFESNKGFGSPPTTGNQVKVKTAGATFSGNGFTAGGTSGATVELVTSRGVAFVGNRFEGVPGLVGVTGTGNAYGISFTGNDFVGTTPTGGQVSGAYSASGNIGLSDRSLSSFHQGEAATHATDYGVSLGWLGSGGSFGGANAVARIGIIDGGTGYLNRTLGYFTPSSNSVPHAFFTWNGSAWAHRASIGSTFNLDVPISFGTDNAADIGASGANRPRTGYFGTSVVTPALNVSGATASRALVTDASKNITSSAVTATELGYLSGVTSAVQTQINTNATNIAAKLNAASPSFTGNITGASSNAQIELGATNKANLSGDSAAAGDYAAGAMLHSKTGSLTLLPSSTNGAAGAKIGAYYYNGSTWRTGWEVANVASGNGTLSLLPGGGNVLVNTTSGSYPLSFSSAIGFTKYQSAAANDALKLVNTGGGATFGVQNTQSNGFSGIEYLDAGGTARVFSGLNNANNEFRFNNMGSGGVINFQIGGSTKAQLKNDGEMYFASNVGINVADPAQPLAVLAGDNLFSVTPNTTINSITGISFGNTNAAGNAAVPMFITTDGAIFRSSKGMWVGGFAGEATSATNRLVVRGFGTTTGTNAFQAQNGSGTALFTVNDSGVVSVVNAQLARALKSQTYAATVAVDWNTGNLHTVTLTGNVTITFANPVAGAEYQIFIKQDAVGGRTITLPTVKWRGGTTPTWTTTASKTDILICRYDGTDYHCHADLNY
ncbi:MAG: hypothetical protein M3209_00110 [Acidobacteriota bacterium]|nr:hypothetical protein [Acidobacteriota bacterium]